MLKNPFVVALAVLALGYSAYAFFTYSRPAVLIPESVEIPCVCIECGEDSNIVATAADSQPMRCPSCSETAAYMWWYCHDCHRRFVPELSGDPPRPTPFPRCTGCGCQSVMGYVPNDPDFPAVGDVPFKNSQKSTKKKTGRP